jgi:hypothetical protein
MSVFKMVWLEPEKLKYHVDPFVVEYQWVASNAARPFPAHHELNGVTVRQQNDPRLAASPDAGWLQVGHYFPGDHAGCGCEWQISFVAGA